MKAMVPIAAALLAAPPAAAAQERIRHARHGRACRRRHRLSGADRRLPPRRRRPLRPRGAQHQRQLHDGRAGRRGADHRLRLPRGAPRLAARRRARAAEAARAATAGASSRATEAGHPLSSPEDADPGPIAAARPQWPEPNRRRSATARSTSFQAPRREEGEPAAGPLRGPPLLLCRRRLAGERLGSPRPSASTSRPRSKPSSAPAPGPAEPRRRRPTRPLYRSASGGPAP